MSSLRPLGWLGSSQGDLKAFPKEVRTVFGVALFEAQGGGTHSIAHALQGYRGHAVYQANEDFDTDTYRLFYTPHPEAVYAHIMPSRKSRSEALTSQIKTRA